MATIHKTTMTPTKLELISSWLPKQSWYAGGAPRLTKVGGFRLDDPAGEVGIEFMVVADESTGRPVCYHLPLTYRAAALPEADAGLIGTSEHGVLGARWIYDGVRDPVLLAQLLALVQGDAEPQAQSVSDTPDRSVVARIAADVRLAPAEASAADGADIPVVATNPAGGEPKRAVLRVIRVLEPAEDVTLSHGVGDVVAGWRLPDGREVRGRFAVVESL